MIYMTYCQPSDCSGLKLDCIQEPLGPGIAHGHIVRSIVVSRREEAVPLLQMEIPSLAITQFYM